MGCNSVILSFTMLQYRTERITHVDEDHIGGIKAWFEHDLTGDIHRGSSGTILSPTPKARPLQAHSRRDGYQPGSVQPRNRLLR